MEQNIQPQRKEARPTSFYKRDQDGQPVGQGTNVLVRLKGESDEQFLKRMRVRGFLGKDDNLPVGHWAPDNQRYHAGSADECLICKGKTRAAKKHLKANKLSKKTVIKVVDVGKVATLKRKNMTSIHLYVPSDSAPLLENVTADSLQLIVSSAATLPERVAGSQSSKTDGVKDETSKVEVPKVEQLGEKQIPVKPEA